MNSRNWIPSLLKKLFGFEDRLDKQHKLRRYFRPHLEQVEERIAPATTPTFVNDNWNLITDNGMIGKLDAGDVVRNNNDTIAPGTITATLGTDAFGTVTTSSVGTVTGVPGSVMGFATITDAIANTTAGGTVNVLEGTYHEMVQVANTVTLKGAQAGVDARARAGVAESIIDNGKGDFQILADNVVIDGFTAQGAITDPNLDLTALGAAIWSNPGFSGTHGGHQIINNIIKDNIAGIELANDGTIQTKVQFNLIKNNTSPGAGTGSGIRGDFSLNNSLIDNNSFLNNPNSSIVLFGGATNTISNNSADNSISILNMMNTQITGNVLMNPVSDGIYVFGGNDGVTISNNEITDPVTAGAADVFVGNPYMDFSVSPNSNVSITNNILHSTATTFGVFIDTTNLNNSAAPVTAYSDPDPLQVKNNALTGPGVGIKNDQVGLAVDASANYWASSNPATVATRITGSGAATVDFTPLLDFNESVANQAVVGFQADLSSLTVHTLGVQHGTTGRLQEGVDGLADGSLMGGARTIHIQGGSYTGNFNTTGKAVTLDTGAGPAQVINNGDFTLDSNDTLVVDISGYAAGTGFDQWVVNGMVSLGSATLVVNDTLSNPVTLGAVFKIIDNDLADPVTGTFTITDPAPVGGSPGGVMRFVVNGHTYEIHYDFGTAPGNGNDVVLRLDANDFFTDMFNRANAANLGSNWDGKVGSFGIDNNKAVSSAIGVSLVTLKGVSAANVSVQADFVLGGAVGNGIAQTAGLVARYTGSGDGTGKMYLGRVVQANGVYTAEIISVVGGAFTTLSSMTLSTSGPNPFNGSGVLRFEVVGNSLKLFVNNVLRVAVRSSTITTAGAVGMRGTTATTNSPTKFDNFTAASVVPTTTTLPYQDQFNSSNGALDRVWTEQTGFFSVQNQIASTFDSNITLATLNTAALTNVLLQANVTLSATSQANVGFAARVSGAPDTNQYVGRVVYNTATATYTAQIDRYVNGVFTSLGSVTLPKTGANAFNGSGLLSFQVSGNTLTLTINGTVLQRTDNSLTSGLVGMRGRSATFANFSAT